MKTTKLRVRAAGLCMALLMPAGQSAGVFAESARFAEPKHGQIAFSDMKYEEVDGGECKALAKQIKLLTKDAANAKRVAALFEDMLNAYNYTSGMESLVSCRI